jgi:hypothetical protein
MTYVFPDVATPDETLPRTVYTVASGDLRLAANTRCWPTQLQLEADFTRAVENFGWSVQRAHGVDPVTAHGFIDSQRRGLEVFLDIPVDAPLVVVDAVCHHVLPGLHRRSSDQPVPQDGAHRSRR